MMRLGEQRGLQGVQMKQDKIDRRRISLQGVSLSLREAYCEACSMSVRLNVCRFKSQ